MSEISEAAPQIGPEELRQLGQLLLSYEQPTLQIVHDPDSVKRFKPLDPVEARSRKMVLARASRQ